MADERPDPPTKCPCCDGPLTSRSRAITVPYGWSPERETMAIVDLLECDPCDMAFERDDGAARQASVDAAMQREQNTNTIPVSV